ncbi:hypothetical protein COY32_01735, partial [candidate division WWE3 bacterium CG_4_10_14_0_2_um_filter_41_14]
MLNSDGKPICTYRDGSSNAATVSGLGSDLANGTWHQGVCVKDNKTAILYIDGVRLGENTNASMGAIDTTGLAKTFGTNSATPATNLLTGQIDDVRIYNRALSAVEIENLYRSTANEVINSTDAIVNTATDGSFDGTDDIQRDTTVTAGLVGWWAMDEVSGSYAYDRSGNGNTGTATGTTVVTGKLGRGRDFNGTSDVVSISDSTSLDITPNITISTWVKLDSVSASYQNFVAKRGSGGFPSNYFLRTGGSNNSDPDEIQFGYYNGSYRVVSTTTANLTTGNWYHVVATHDNSSEKVYINGVQYSTVWRWGTSSTSLLADNETLAIGRGGSMNGEYTDGTIDDVRIYNRALSPSEIQTIYAEGQKAITGSVSVSADVKPSVIGSTAVGGMVAGKGSNYELGTIGGIGGTGARSSFTTNAITTQLSGTSINDVYFYDTTLDTDYGTGKSTDPLVWRFDSSKSWYTETIDATYAACNVSTNDRCGTKYFPEKSYIVATDTGNESTSYVYIFDAESNAMWMRFDQWGGVASIHFMIPGTFVTSVFMLDGTFYAGLENYSGRYGVTTANFVNDTGVLYRGDDHVGNWNGNIGVRNTSGYDHVDTGTAIHDILAANVNDVHAAVINGKTYVAVATADGWSLINE